MAKSRIIDRSLSPDHRGDCYIVTGSIGPQFQPLLFMQHKNAIAYAEMIEVYGERMDVYPPFIPIIEYRYQCNMSMLPED